MQTVGSVSMRTSHAVLYYAFSSKKAEIVSCSFLFHVCFRVSDSAREVPDSFSVFVNLPPVFSYHSPSLLIASKSRFHAHAALLL